LFAGIFLLEYSFSVFDVGLLFFGVFAQTIEDGYFQGQAEVE
jgi:hypothetical protein